MDPAQYRCEAWIGKRTQPAGWQQVAAGHVRTEDLHAEQVRELRASLGLDQATDGAKIGGKAAVVKASKSASTP